MPLRIFLLHYLILCTGNSQLKETAVSQIIDSRVSIRQGTFTDAIRFAMDNSQCFVLAYAAVPEETSIEDYSKDRIAIAIGELNTDAERLQYHLEKNLIMLRLRGTREMSVDDFVEGLNVEISEMQPELVNVFIDNPSHVAALVTKGTLQ
jgi:hypothetical protein